MTPETQRLIQRLLDGETVPPSSPDPAAAPDEPTGLVVAALLGDGRPAALDRAAALATTSRDRQLVAIADAHLAGDADRVEALARDHLSDHPDGPAGAVVAWMVTHPRSPRPAPGSTRPPTEPPPDTHPLQHQEPS